MTVIAAAFVGWIALTSPMQIPGLKRPSLGDIPGVSDIFRKGPAITSSLKDAKYEAKEKDGFSPDVHDLYDLPRTPSGAFVLKAGDWGMVDQSYCLHAGTYGPGGGDGYLYAPVLGPFKEQVMSVVHNSVQHPEIDQHDIQLLLWAIVARTKITDMPSRMQQIAGKLLTSKQLLDLNGGALGLLTDEKIGGAFIKEPPLLRQVYEAEAKLRNLLTSPDATFDEMERVAVLVGVPPVGKGSRDVPRGRWSLHPDGYYVRYMPSGYSTTKIEIYVPENSAAIGKEFDPSTHIAMPGDTGRQRLIQSGRRQVNH